jgi:hypothetical protein
MIRSKTVVIGGGFAAVKCARTLRKALANTSPCFSSVKKNHMVFHPMLADVSTSVSSVADFSFGGRLFSLGQGSRPGLDGLSLYIYFSPRCRATFFRHFLGSPVYLSASRQFSMSALEDQQCAAALMWTCVTMIYLMPAAILAMRLLAAGGLPEDELA